MQGFLVNAVLVLVPMILSLSVHEYAHALVADRLGDDTPRLMGRLTVNPLAHIDPLGSLVVPLLGLMSGFFFGWARPVMINPLRLRGGLSMGTGRMLVAAAGPAANLALAFLSVGLYTLLRQLPAGEAAAGLNAFLARMLMINVVLAAFNLIPIPPLDGSRVLFGLLPRGLQGIERTAHSVAPMLFIALILMGGPVLGPLFRALAQGIDWMTFGQAAQLLRHATLG